MQLCYSPDAFWCHDFSPQHPKELNVPQHCNGSWAAHILLSLCQLWCGAGHSCVLPMDIAVTEE